MASLASQAERDLLAVVRDPVKFQRGVLKRNIWAAQQRICQAIEHRRHVAVKACHASGKTFVAAGIVPWWLACYPASKVLTVAPTLRQVRLMWDEISLAVQASDPIRFPEPSTVALKIAEDHYAMGMSSSRGVNIQGFHGYKVLIIVDEAPGVMKDIWDAIEGIRAGGDVTLLELGNPTVPSGHFFENFSRGRRTCDCITISAFDTPNFAGVSIERLLEMSEDELNQAPQRYLVSRAWVKERYQRWGPQHAMYMARVLGEFPTQAEDSVFSLEWIERAGREATEDDIRKLKAAGHVIRFGLDVAGPGDAETVLIAQVGGMLLGMWTWAKADPRGELVAKLSEFRNHKQWAMGAVMVDTIGIGYHFATHLADNGFEVYGFNAGGGAVDAEHFVNAKAEGYWALREFFERGAVRGLEDEETKAQLSSIRYFHTPAGRVQIESKDDARKRGVASPDRAEAWMLAFVPVMPKHQVVTNTLDYSISPY